MDKKGMVYEVFSPEGEVTVPVQPAAPRLDTLNGKTICELSSHMYNAHVSFPIIRELLIKRYPDIKIVPFTEIDKGIPGNSVLILTGKEDEQEAKEQGAVAAMKAHGCDAAIIGNGG